MKIAVTGASGLVGSALASFLTTGGHDVYRLVRRAARAGEIQWDPERGTLDPKSLEGIDAVVHLAGESVGQRWSADVKRRILESRVRGTSLVATAAAAARPRPSVLVCASAVGYYGDTRDQVADERSPEGRGFLAEVASAWERAADPAREAGIRVVHVRLGVVLTPAGGALRKMLMPFKLGAGGVIGSGDQGFPWISIDDAVGVFHHALMQSSLAGPVNAVAPQITTNRDFTKALGRALSRPTILSMPAFAASLVFGEMGREMLLAGQRVDPRVLRAGGYRWTHTTLDAALRDLLPR